MSAKSWYEIRNIAESSAEIFLYDQIGGWGISASQFVRELRALKGKELTVRVHSPGGSILEGHAIYNALLRHEGGVVVQIDGIAASMAGVIAMAGKPVKMAENAFLMIHNPSGVAEGGSDDMRKQADIMDKMRDGLVNIFVQRTGKSAEEVEEVMDAETWFTAQEAKDYGLIDEITDRLEIAASFDLSQFKNSGRVDIARAVSMSAVTATLELDSTAFKASLAEAEKDLAAFVAKLTAAQTQARDNFANLQAITAERDTLSATVAAQVTDIANLTAQHATTAKEFQTYKDGEVERINAAVAREIAKSGTTAPLDSHITTQNPAGDEKPDLSQLKGRDRLVASTAAQLSRK